MVYNTAAGGMTAAAPPYEAGWATEIALDVQWAHATAPLARIVLIEAADASLNSLLGSIKLANAMGPGVVSMSFGTNEGNWTSSVDAAFSGVNMTYLAATGDWGSQVIWPSVSSKVVAVGGATLSSVGNGTRSEVGWTLTGGGISAYTATPSYQASNVPGLGSVARRAVADVAFNADPKSGQYVAVINAGASAASWVGSNGTCSLCTAKAGYDALTGLGTPNVTSLLTALTGSAANQAPIVTTASISGKVATPLSFTVSVSSTNPVTYALSGAPSGMAISTAGVVTWANPVIGTYPVTVTAKDSKTQLSGQGIYTVSIAQVPAPVVTAAAITGSVGKALSFTPRVTASNPVTLSMSGAPAGMALSATGVVTWSTSITGVAGKAVSGTIGISDATSPSVRLSISGVPLGMTFALSGSNIIMKWANPVTGSYNLKLDAIDSAGLTAQVTIPVTISPK